MPPGENFSDIPQIDTNEERNDVMTLSAHVDDLKEKETFKFSKEKKMLRFWD